MYWNIRKILPYQRCFNFINGERSIGKTYTTQKFVIKKALQGQEFVYITRTQDEKKSGFLEKAFSKVLVNEYKDIEVECTSDEMYKIIKDENEVVIQKILLGYCIALSEAAKVKKKSFPNVKYLVFDEYMLEDAQTKSYVNGWKEPDLLLSIYHTIDREQDKVICFLLGNNTSFYNPYHMHLAFNIPHVEKGDLWYSDNVLFQWATATDNLKESKSKCKFLKMIDKTSYGTYAKYGDYVDDNVEFIESRTAKAKIIFNIQYNGTTYGIWSDANYGKIFIDEKFDPSCKLLYALTTEDHKENTLLTKGKTSSMLTWLGKNFKLGNVRFVSMPVKVKTESAVKMLL